ncbi:MAG TPA: hypothetical protein VE911_01915 [Candidatus Nitrosopolaris sp.]|nr:hypothetical protein [Candidatus Nitrosopolaris sp.]
MTPRIAIEGVQRCRPSERVSGPRRGDFVLIHGGHWTSWLIQAGQALRYRGDSRRYTYWNHAAIFSDDRGHIIEALGGGVVERHISVYDAADYHVVFLRMADLDRDQVVAFARHCRDQDYGYLTIASLTLSLLTGLRLGFGVDGQEICSGLVARALERAGEIFAEEPWHATPAGLAKFYGILPPDDAVHAERGGRSHQAA